MDKPTAYVVLDSTVWRSNFLLRTPLGAALLFILQGSEGRLILPAIVESEVIKVISEHGLQEANKIVESFRILGMIRGSTPNYQPPSRIDFQQDVKGRFEELSRILHRVPIKSEQYQSALNRVMEDLPPNSHGREQFKDSLVWEAVMDVVRHASENVFVHFVSEDKDFYQKKGEGFATELIKEGGERLRLHKNLSGCLQAIREKAPPLDRTKITKLVSEAIHPDLEQAASKEGLVPGSLIKANIEGFLTETIEQLAIGFSLTYKLEQHDADLLPGGELEASGEARYDQVRDEIIQAQLDTIKMQWRDRDGTLRSPQILFASGQTETRTIPFRLKQPLEGTDNSVT